MAGSKSNPEKIRELAPLVRCYLDLHCNAISEPGFSNWMRSLKPTHEELEQFRQEAFGQGVSERRDRA